MKDFTPREADVLADLPNVVAFPRPAEPEPEPERLVTRSDTNELVAALVAEVTEQLNSHRAFIADQLAEVVAALVDGSVEHVNKQVDAVRTELLTQIEMLRAETAQLRAEVASLSAVDFADGRAATAALKH